MLDTALDWHLRKGRIEDADALAELINYAGEGLPLYFWGRMAEEGETAWDVGRKRAQREEGAFSYKNALVADVSGEAAACLIGYTISEEPEPIDTDSMPPIVVPLVELENLTPGSWYVNVLAAKPEYRGQGIGTRLMQVAEEKAREAGCRILSIIVSDANTGARNLYKRCGCVEQATRPMVKDGWENEGQNWVLLTKELA